MASEEGGNRLTNRLRIIYGFARIGDKNHVLIERIAFRDEATYRA